jgi:hypothetical protein
MEIEKLITKSNDSIFKDKVEEILKRMENSVGKLGKL